MINLLIFNRFYPVIEYRRVEKESDELLYTVWSLVMVRNPVAKRKRLNFIDITTIFRQISVFHLIDHS